MELPDLEISRNNWEFDLRGHSFLDFFADFSSLTLVLFFFLVTYSLSDDLK